MSASAMAAVLGISTRRLAQLSAAGTVSRGTTAHYRFPENVHEYVASLHAPAGGETFAELRSKDLETKIKQREQTMDERRGELQEQIQGEMYAELFDLLAEYRSAIQRLSVDPKTMADLNRLLGEAIAAMEKRQNKP